MVKLLFKPFSYQGWINVSLLVIRLYASVMMLTHGGPKFMRLLSGNLKFGDPLGIGSEVSFVLVVFAEFFCSILLLLGLGTRLATIPLIITMLVALLIAHAADPVTDHINILGYLAVYALLFGMAGGRYSLDYRLFKKH